LRPRLPALRSATKLRAVPRDEEVIKEHRKNDSLRPLARLQLFLDAMKSEIDKRDTPRDCLFVSCFIGATASIRRRLAGILEEFAQAVAYRLNAAGEAGELDETIDCVQVAEFVGSSIQGQ
jgi:TetR/AcrR family transcriptional repressor of nem operon